MLQCAVIIVWLSVLYLNTAISMEYSSGYNMAEHKTALNNIPTHSTVTHAQYDDDFSKEGSSSVLRIEPTSLLVLAARG